MLTVGVVSSEQIATFCDGRCIGMTEVQGNFVLDAALDDLTGLECISAIAGALQLQGTGVTSIEGLANLSRIRGDLLIEGEPNLSTLTGLGMLGEIDGTLRLADNGQLLGVTTGLESLLKVGGDLEIIDNPRVSEESASALVGGIVVTGTATLDNNGRGLDFVDAGFENKRPTDGLPIDWLVYPEDATNGTIAISSETFTARTDSGSLRIVVPPKGATATTVYQEHREGFSAGEAFELTGYVYISSEEPIEDGCLTFLTIKYFGPNLSFIGLTASGVEDYNSARDTWKPLLVLGTIPSGAVMVQAGAELAHDGVCTGAVYFDDLEMRKVSL